MRNRNFNQVDLKQWQERRQKNKVFFGIALAVVGFIMLLKSMGVIPYYMLRFHTSWPIILIAVGAFLGIKNNFRRNAWWILILIGAANLTPQFMIMGQPSSHFVWPAMIILAGIVIAVRPHRSHCIPRAGDISTAINTDSTLNIDLTFGGRKEIVTSKEFKGGMVNVTFAGCEINLTQADFAESAAVIDFRVSFSGVEVIVPSHWDVQNEVSPSFGSVEDERTLQTAAGDNKKTLILRGTCSFGSIEIKSY